MKIRLAGHDFDGPYRAVSWTPPFYGGVLAVMVEDAAYRPRPYRVIYFGQAQDFSQRGLLKAHPKYRDWLAAGRTEHGLYVATYRMPGATELARLALERYLIHYYQPQCNEVASAWGAR